MNISKKQINVLKHNAFNAFKSFFNDEEWKSMWNVSSSYICYEITEGQKHQFTLFSDSRQMNYNWLNENGFSEKAMVKILFVVSKQTKTLTYK